MHGFRTSHSAALPLSPPPSPAANETTPKDTPPGGAAMAQNEEAPAPEEQPSFTPDEVTASPAPAPSPPSAPPSAYTAKAGYDGVWSESPRPPPQPSTSLLVSAAQAADAPLPPISFAPPDVTDTPLEADVDLGAPQLAAAHVRAPAHGLRAILEGAQPTVLSQLSQVSQLSQRGPPSPVTPMLAKDPSFHPPPPESIQAAAAAAAAAATTAVTSLLQMADMSNLTAERALTAAYKLSELAETLNQLASMSQGLGPHQQLATEGSEADTAVSKMGPWQGGAATDATGGAGDVFGEEEGVQLQTPDKGETPLPALRP